MRPRRTILRLECLEERSLLADASGVVQGVAFIDANTNGRFDGGELPVVGLGVTLSGTTTLGNRVSAEAVTDGSGAFRFLNVLPGGYNLGSNPRGELVGSPSFAGVTGPAGVTIAGLPLTGGQTASGNFGFSGPSPQTLSLRQFLTSTPEDTFVFATAGTGTTLVNVRENNRPFVETTLGDVTVGKNSNRTTIDLAGHFDDRDVTNSLVRFATSEGSINVALFDTTAPRSVANFFNYVTSNRYDNSIFHRREGDFVLQGGGFSFQAGGAQAGAQATLPPLRTDAAVKNEFRTSNTIGTLAYAKVGGNIDSATSQFFFNLTDNTELNRNDANNQFTVFGRIVGRDDQAVINQLADIPIRDVSSGPGNGAFNQMPLLNFTGSVFPGDTSPDNFALIRDVEVVRRDETLTYSVVGNSNSGLVTARVENNRLLLDYTRERTGTARLTVRATDRFGAFVDASFNVNVNNRAPTVATAEITPTAPVTSSVLTARVTGADIDGDAVRFTYVWKVKSAGGAEVERQRTTNTASTTDTFDLSKDTNGNKGDEIILEVTPLDGTVEGPVVRRTVTVGNSAPRVDQIVFNPTAPGTDETLTATATVSDPDGDPISLTYVWRVNGTVVRTTPSSISRTDSLDLSQAGNGNSGDTIVVEITPNDGTVNGAVLSRSVVVA